jgi:hypothetical protein
VRQWGLRARIDPVLVFDAKGGENKAKAKKMDQLPLENFENCRIELLFWQNPLIVSLCQKLVSCGENV